jgi:phosphoserine phosphatase
MPLNNLQTRFVIVTVSGEDKPGVTSALTGILQLFDCEILDISQSVIHDQLSLSFIVEIPQEQKENDLLKELLFKAHELHLQIHFNALDSAEYASWVSQEKTSRFIITILGRRILARPVHKISQILAQNNLNISDLGRLSQRIPLGLKDPNSKACMEIKVTGEASDLDRIRKEFLEISKEENVDIAIQVDDVYRRNRRLVAFDMDSTLIQTEVIDELAMRAGSGVLVKSITEAAMRGEIDFDESLRQRVSTLKGLPESVMKEIAETLPVTEGAQYLVQSLKKFGYKVAVISGGFTYFGNHLKDLLGLDYVFANELEIIDGVLTGNVLGTIINGNKKAEILKQLCDQEGIEPEQAIAVGDGANDLPMLSLAGLGIAFHAKPIVREKAQASMSQVGLDGILYLMGFRDREIRALNLSDFV